MSVIHIVGAGLAGLSTAVALAGDGKRVVLHEAAAQAGGRCRSLLDSRLNCRIDNGNHLLMTGNRHTLAYLDAIGAADQVSGPVPAAYPFVDVGDARQWTVRPGRGRIPWWILDPRRRVPLTAPAHYLSVLSVIAAGKGRTVADCVGQSGRLVKCFWEPLTVAVLNTPLVEASAGLLRQALKRTLMKGEPWCRPLIAGQSLSATFVDPALAYLASKGVDIRLSSRLCSLQTAGGRVERLEFASTGISLDREDSVVLALPPSVAGDLVAGLEVPRKHQGIVNVHFRLPGPVVLPGGHSFVGLIGGMVQWIFVRDHMVSVTVSAANDMIHLPLDEIATTAWRDVASVLDADPHVLPPWRVIKERRATISQDPDTIAMRPGTRTAFDNLYLAGDWTDTGLPATIEGAVLSGKRAARACEEA